MREQQSTILPVPEGKKLRQFALGIGLLALVLVLSISAFASMKNKSLASANVDLNSELEGIPIFPGAEQLYPQRGEVPNDHFNTRPGAGQYQLKTPNSRTEVEAFYKKSLAERGWNLVYEGTSRIDAWDSIGLVFTWTNPNEGIPRRRYLGVSLRILQNSTTEINLDFERWPDPNQVPLYPNAEQVEDDVRPNESGFPVRVIRFLSDASPSDIDAYYNDILVQHGWWKIEPYPEATDQSPFYNYAGQSPPGPTASSVRVHIQPDAGGRTQVELIVTNISGEYK